MESRHQAHGAEQQHDDLHSHSGGKLEDHMEVAGDLYGAYTMHDKLLYRKASSACLTGEQMSIHVMKILKSKNKMEEEIEMLRVLTSGVPLFQRLDPNLLTEMLGVARFEKHDRNTILFRQGQVGAKFNFILKGEVEILQEQKSDSERHRFVALETSSLRGLERSFLTHFASMGLQSPRTHTHTHTTHTPTRAHTKRAAKTLSTVIPFDEWTRARE